MLHLTILSQVPDLHKNQKTIIYSQYYIQLAQNVSSDDGSLLPVASGSDPLKSGPGEASSGGGSRALGQIQNGPVTPLPGGSVPSCHRPSIPTPYIVNHVKWHIYRDNKSHRKSNESNYSRHLHKS